MSSMSIFPISGLQQFCRFYPACSQKDVENAIKEYANQGCIQGRFVKKTATEHTNDLYLYMLSKIGPRNCDIHKAYITQFLYDLWSALCPRELTHGESIPVTSDQFDYEPEDDGMTDTECMTDTEDENTETGVTLQDLLKD
jgi:hypothetical protein